MDLQFGLLALCVSVGGVSSMGPCLKHGILRFKRVPGDGPY